jgi:hypothetical protein
MSAGISVIFLVDVGPGRGFLREATDAATVASSRRRQWRRLI